MLYASDLITQYLPWYYAVQQSLHQVRLPYLLLAEGETGILSPINALILFLFSFPYAVTLLYFTYAFISVTGTYLFLRRHGLTHISSLLGGLIFTFSGFMLSRYFQPSIIFSAALLPWGFLYLNSYLLPFIIYLQITAGHLQIALISILAYLIYAFKPRTILLVVLGLGLSAMQLLPSLQLYSLSDRRSWDPMVRFTYSLPPSHLITYFFPDWFGISAPGDNLGFTQFGGSFWEFNLTIWTLPFLLSLLPLLKLSRSTLVLYALWVLFLILSFGGYTPLYRILARSPQFPFRAPSRFLLIPTFAASALAAIGFHGLSHRRPLRRQLIAFTLVILSIVFQFARQLKNYFLFHSAGSIGPATTTPLPLNPDLISSPPDFVVKFHQGLVITLLSLLILIKLNAKTYRLNRLISFTHRR